jgi:hypothetical protein
MFLSEHLFNYPRRIKNEITNAKIARASVRAAEIKNFLSRISAADGFLPIASLYDEKTIPIPIPTPRMGRRAIAAAKSFADSGSIV